MRSRLEQINANFLNSKMGNVPCVPEVAHLVLRGVFLVALRLPRRRAKFQNGWALAHWPWRAPCASSDARSSGAAEAIEQEREDTGHVVLCRTCCDIQSRFVIAMPPRAKQAQRAKQDDLLGGDEASAAESGDEASTVSSDADQVSDCEAEAEREEKKATAQPL